MAVTLMNRITVHGVKPCSTILKYLTTAVSNILTRKEKIRMGVLVLSDLVIGLLDIAFLGILLLVINFYTKNSTPASAVFLHFFADGHSLFPVGVFLLLFGVKNWLGYRISAAQHSFFYSVSSRLSRQNILFYLQDSHTKFIHIDSSVLIRKISQQPIEFSNYILTNIQQVISQGILIFFTLAALLFYYSSLFLLLFLLLLPPVVLLGFLIRKRLRHIRSNIKTTSEKAIQHLQESLSGFIESNIYQKNLFFTNRYHEYQKQLNDNISVQQTLQSLPSRLIEVFALLGFFILIAINKLSAGTPFIDLLTIGVLMAASYKIIPGMVKILNSTGQIKTYEFILKDLLPADKMSLPFNYHQQSENNTRADETPSSHTAKLPGMPIVNLAQTVPLSSVRFEQVGFSYKQHQVLDDFSFELLPGDFTGISGRSGMGKTTIINLLLGFLTQQSGEILISDKAGDSIERQLYWPAISYVKQQPFFINDSILKNITLSDGGYDQQRLAEVVSFCGIDRMLDQYPDGISKLITENGKNISGGQRQRIMLARALYPDFDLLLLDEPFGEMDEEAEREILMNLQLLARKGKMILLITHNKSSLSFCNKTITLHEEQ